MRFRSFLLLCFLIFFSWSPLALSNRISKIIIKGNQTVEASAIRSKLSSKRKQSYSLWKVQKDVKNLFGTGWFYNIDVSLNRDKKGAVVLVYKVKEKPIVEKIIYKGNDDLSKKELDEIFRVFRYTFLDHKKIREAMDRLRTEYEKKGYYLVEISHSIKKISHLGFVQLVIHIQENEKITINRIHFIGNESIPSDELRSFMSNKERELFSFISSTGIYNEESLEKDLNNIRFIYLDRGYWKVHIEKPEVFISPDRKDLTIYISITEGDSYKLGSINFGGELVFTEDYLKEGLQTKELEIFSYGKFQKDIERIQKKYGDKGYAFVNVVPKFFNQPGDDKVIHVLFNIQKGKKVKIGMIHIKGNQYTRDKVIRREVRIFETDLYNETKKDQSLANIKRLGFFDEVEILPKTIKDRDDLVDIDVIVKERENTGVFELGVQFDASFGFSINLRLHKLNLFGKGYNFGLDTNLSKTRQFINFAFSDPFFLDSKWYFGTSFSLNNWDESSRSFFGDCEIYERALKENKNGQQDLGLAQQACLVSLEKSRNHRGFSEQKIGTGITLGRFLTDSFRLFLNYKLERVNIKSNIDRILFSEKEASGFRDPIEGSLEYDTRDDRLFPTSGIHSRGSLAYNGLFGKFNYTTLSGYFRFYQKLMWDLVFRTNVTYSQYFDFEDSDPSVPFDRLFLLGGINQLRGFQYFSVGPRKQSDTIFRKAVKYGHPNPKQLSQLIYGGMREFYTNIELQIPIFPKARFLGIVFLDVGSAYDEIESIDLRANWGFGIRVFTPLAPIRIEWGFPFRPREEQGESRFHFNFAMGLPF